MKAIRRWPSYEVFLGLLSPKTTLHCNAEAFKASLTRNKNETMGFKFGRNECGRETGLRYNFPLHHENETGPSSCSRRLLGWLLGTRRSAFSKFCYLS